MIKLGNLAKEDIPAFAASYAGFLAVAHETFLTAPTRLQHNIRLSDYIRFRVHKRRRKKPVKRIFDHLIDTLGNESEGVVLEFGVHEGISTRIIGNGLPNAKIHGFDSFVGFPEDGRTDWQHDFSVANLPEVPSNATLHQGFFEDTLGPFMKNEGASISRDDVLFIHIDCDIYSSTVTVLDHLSPLIGPGTILVFDELMNNPKFATNEFLAFYEFLRERNLDFAWHTVFGDPFPFEERHGKMAPDVFRRYREQRYYQNQAIVVTEQTADGHIARGEARKIHQSLIDNIAEECMERREQIT